jgi:hypothetical protein
MIENVTPVFMIFLVLLVSGALGGMLAANRGRNVVVWCILSALIPLFLFVIYYAKPICEVEGKFKRCTSCGEYIKWHDPVCKFCRSEQKDTGPAKG